MSTIPNREDLDREITNKLVAMLARQWEDPAPFVQLVKAYAAMRQMKMLDDMGAQLSNLWGAIDDVRETLLIGFTTGFDEDPLIFKEEEEEDEDATIQKD